MTRLFIVFLIYFIGKKQTVKEELLLANDFNGKLTFVDLFAGCGGLSLGLEFAGFHPIYVNELNTDALETYLINRDRNYPHLRNKFHSRDIKEMLMREGYLSDLLDQFKRDFKRDFRRDTVDLIVGGPPCQGFSGIGHRRNYAVEKANIPSNHLFQDMAKVIEFVRPKMFLFENVEGLLRSRWTNRGTKGEVFNDVFHTFRSLFEYSVKFKLVFAKDYGVPQNRPRLVIIGVRSDLLWLDDSTQDAFEAGLLPPISKNFPDLEDILSDLIDENFSYGGHTLTYPHSAKNDLQRYFRRQQGTEFIAKKGSPISEHQYSNHSARVIERFNYMIKNDGRIPEHLQTKKFAQRVLPRKWEESSPNITACSVADDFVHFSQPRSLTVREWARIQTFPDWYQFAGKRTTGGLRRAGNPVEGIFEREVPKYTQIGNAVPVKLAYEIGCHFHQILVGRAYAAA